MPYAKAWLIWGTAVLTSFAVIEAKALVSTTPNATLSANLRRAFGFSDDRWHAGLRRLTFYAALGWLAHHIAAARTRM